jgi:hypothetical protein
MDDAPTTLDDFRVMTDAGRVVLQMAVIHDDGGVDFLRVGMTTRQARELAPDLIANAERVEGEAAT